jgi:hypothetical protein
MNIQEFRSRFPQYGALSDEDLAQRLYRKHYASKFSWDEFSWRFGLPDKVAPAGVPQKAPPVAAAEPVAPLTPEYGAAATYPKEAGYGAAAQYPEGAQPPSSDWLGDIVDSMKSTLAGVPGLGPEAPSAQPPLFDRMMSGFLPEPWSERPVVTPEQVQQMQANLPLTLGAPPQPSGFQAWDKPLFETALTDPFQAGLARLEQGLTDDPVRRAEQQRLIERYAPTDETAAGLEQIAGAKTFTDALGAVVANPSALWRTGVESLGMYAPAIPAIVGASAAGPIGTAAAAGTTSGIIEYTQSLTETMVNAGLDPSRADHWQRALTDPVLMASAKDRGIKRGLAVGAFDALTAGLAGKFLAGAKPTVSSVGGRLFGELGMQAGGGMAGEASGQALTGEWNPGEILMEGLVEVPTAAVEIPANLREARAAAQRNERDANLKALGDYLLDAESRVQPDPQAIDALARQALSPQQPDRQGQLPPELAELAASLNVPAPAGEYTPEGIAPIAQQPGEVPRTESLGDLLARLGAQEAPEAAPVPPQPMPEPQVPQAAPEQPPAPTPDFRGLGRLAFARGVKAAPILDLDLQKALADAGIKAGSREWHDALDNWQSGWQQANVDAPVEPSTEAPTAGRKTPWVDRASAYGRRAYEAGLGKQDFEADSELANALESFRNAGANPDDVRSWWEIGWEDAQREAGDTARNEPTPREKRIVANLTNDQLVTLGRSAGMPEKRLQRLVSMLQELEDKRLLDWGALEAGSNLPETGQVSTQGEAPAPEPQLSPKTRALLKGRDQVFQAEFWRQVRIWTNRGAWTPTLDELHNFASGFAHGFDTGDSKIVRTGGEGPTHEFGLGASVGAGFVRSLAGRGAQVSPAATPAPDDIKAERARKKAEERAARQRAKGRIDQENDDILTILAKAGGIARGDLGGEIDPANFDRRPVFGKPLFRKTGGMSLDGAAEFLRQYGFETRRPDDVVSLIKDALAGNPVYSPTATGWLEKQAAQRQEEGPPPDDDLGDPFEMAGLPADGSLLANDEYVAGSEFEASRLADELIQQARALDDDATSDLLEGLYSRDADDDVIIAALRRFIEENSRGNVEGNEAIPGEGPGGLPNGPRAEAQPEAPQAPVVTAVTPGGEEQTDWVGGKTPQQQALADEKANVDARLSGKNAPQGEPGPILQGGRLEDELFDQAPAAPELAKPAADTNTVFTKEAADAALARLRAKLGGPGTLRSGFDPTILADGIVLGGYYIEKGVREFGAWARQMYELLGDGVKPYLVAIYEGIRDQEGLPAATREAMTAPEAVRPALRALEAERAAPQAAPAPTEASRATGRDRDTLYAALAGRDVQIEVQAGGETMSVSRNAADALRDADRLLAALEEMRRNCL